MKKLTTILSAGFITLSLFGMLALHSCKKSGSNCYSAELAEQNKNNFCTTDCPGVIACDGKTYCNTCEAARAGYLVFE